MIREYAIDFEERHPDIFEFSILGGQILLWPIVRAKLLLDLDDPSCGKAQEKTKKESGSAIEKKLAMFWAGIRNSAVFIRRPVMVFSTSLVNVRQKDGTYWNRLYGSMLTYWPEKVAIVEWGGRDMRPSRMGHKVYYPDLFLAFASAVSRFSRLSTSDVACIKQFILYIQEHFLDPLQRSYEMDSLQKIITDVAGRYKGYKIMLDIWKRISGVRFVIIEDAAYGGMNAVLVSVLKNLGVTVGELQHGLIYENHMAYWYSNAVCDRRNNYHRHLPDYFFTYGEFWRRFVRIPSRICNVGNDFLNGKACVHVRNGRPVLLLVSGVIRYDLYVEILIALARELNGIVDLILKPHPTERSVVEERYGILSRWGVKVELNESIYDLLAKVDYVVGDHSTALVEALAFGHTPFIFDSDYSRAALGAFPMEYFSSPDMLVGMVKERLGQSRRELSDEISSIWEKDFRGSFQAVLEEILNVRVCG